MHGVSAVERTKMVDSPKPVGGVGGKHFPALVTRDGGWTLSTHVITAGVRADHMRGILCDLLHAPDKQLATLFAGEVSDLDSRAIPDRATRAALPRTERMVGVSDIFGNTGEGFAAVRVGADELHPTTRLRHTVPFSSEGSLGGCVIGAA
jgi:hypothetical protein